MENAITRTPHLDSRLERARTHCANPSPYLTGNYNISLRARIVKQLLGEISNYRILDLGCGDGTISLQFLAANNHITLVDLSDGMLQRAKRNTPSESVTHVDYMCWDIFESTPMPGSTWCSASACLLILVLLREQLRRWRVT